VAVEFVPYATVAGTGCGSVALFHFTFERLVLPFVFDASKHQILFVTAVCPSVCPSRLFAC
jgi:hypothetical protein